MTGGQKREREKRARTGHAEHRREEFVGILDFGDIVPTAGVKGCGGNNQDRGIDEEREHQRERRINCRELDCFAFARRAQLIIVESARSMNADTNCGA